MFATLYATKKQEPKKRSEMFNSTITRTIYAITYSILCFFMFCR